MAASKLARAIAVAVGEEAVVEATNPHTHDLPNDYWRWAFRKSAGANCLLNIDGIDELPEDWLVDCSQDSESYLPPEEMTSRATTVEKPDNISAAEPIIRATSVGQYDYHGDATLIDLNKMIQGAPSFKIKHKNDEDRNSHKASVINEKPLVNLIKIYTEGGKQRLTISRNVLKYSN
nr:unnamed protein product [Digitaria exilis]